ncbi:peptidoglycan-binding protein [Desulfobulbus sp. US5]|nr:peptidoglycan-binding protein [Desulfobulbus sp. US4]MCW5213780.1 peptidoglycan-binding protein [Desulfobulbus sp. US5]WLE96759.1 MAG: peptidoglycan-binding domain-containing protein [Candidatus Electrothrix communis]
MLKKRNFMIAAAFLFAVSSPAVAQQYGQVDPGQYVNEGFPTNVQPGECYSRCLAPAVYEDVEEEIEVAPAMERTEITPAEYEWVDEQVIAKEASEQIETLPAKFEWTQEEVVVKEASEEIKVVPAQYEWRDEQVVVKEATEELKSIPAKYEWIDEQIMISPEVITITITDPGYEEVKEQVLVKAPSAKWIKKATHCSPEDIKMGLTDCDTLCYVAVPAMYKMVIKKVPTDDCGGVIGGCRQEVVIPAEYKVVRKKVVVEPARTETVSVPAEYRTMRKQVMIAPARTDVVTNPPVTQMIRKKVMVAPSQTRVIPVPPEYKSVRVKKLVKPAEENVITVPAEYKTIIKKVKVSDSKIVWKPALCKDELVDSTIRQVQTALSQMGFYTGLIDGQMNQATNEAIRAFQVENGLAQGGGLTEETVEALGIY